MECLERVMLEPCLLQPCFHVAGTIIIGLVRAPYLGTVASTTRCSALGVGGIRVESSSNCCGSKKPITGSNLPDNMREQQGLRFHRNRDFKQSYFNSIPPTSTPRGGADCTT